MDQGTLFQLKRLINRRNVVNDPSKSVASCEEFFLLVVEAHIIASAMKLFGMKNLDDSPSTVYFPENCEELASTQKHRIFKLAMEAIVKEFVDLDLTYKEQVVSQHPSKIDSVREYACEVLTLGLLLMEFNDGIHEGDGNRIFRCWSYFLLLFKASNRTNYSIEAFNLLANYHYLLSPRQAMQLKWSRTVNVHGYLGRNIPGDLHMEHLNRECKDALHGLGANITDKSVQRVGKCIGRMMETLEQFDKVNGVPKVSGRHTQHSTERDLKKVLKQLCEADVFGEKQGRCHNSFKKFTKNLVNKVSCEELKKWMNDRICKLKVYM